MFKLQHKVSVTRSRNVFLFFFFSNTKQRSSRLVLFCKVVPFTRQNDVMVSFLGERAIYKISRAKTHTTFPRYFYFLKLSINVLRQKAHRLHNFLKKVYDVIIIFRCK